GEIEDYAWPAVAKWAGDCWSLGVKLSRRNIPKVAWWSLECQLEYYVEYGLYCSVAEWFPAKIADRVFDKFRRVNPKVVHEHNNGVWLETEVKIEEVSAFEKPLETLFEDWIKLWKKVGGIKEIVKG